MPPPASRLRTLLVGVVAVALAIGIGWLWTTGRANPIIGASNGSALGGEGPVYVNIRVRSASAAAIEIVEGFGEPPGLRLLGYSVSAGSDDIDGTVVTLSPADREVMVHPDPFPMRIEPGASRWLEAVYEVTDCDAIRRTTDANLRVTARIADGPFSLWSRRRPVYDLRASAPDGHPGWPAALTQFACPVPN